MIKTKVRAAIRRPRATVLAREQRFTADAAHGLCPPLAVLKAQIGLALRRPRSAAALTAMLRTMATDVDRCTS